MMRGTQNRRVGRRGSNSESGMVLPMVLVMITVVAVVLIALLSLATTTLAASVVAKSTSDRTYAAHAGIDAAIQQIRAGGTLCSDGSKTPININGRPVVVTCSPAANGFDVGAGGWAVFINPAATPTPGIETHNAVNAAKVITGPVFNGGNWTDLGANLTVADGQVLSSAVGCGDANWTANVITTPVANFKACVGGAAPAPPANPSLPTISDTGLPVSLPVNPPSIVTGTGGSACRTFVPGIYTTAQPFTLSPNMYFMSGVYLLDNVGAVLIGKTRKAVAGAPTAGYTPTITPCNPVADQPGAMFLLGGNSGIEVTDGGQFEVHTFIASSTSSDSPVAVRTVEATDVGKQAWLTNSTVSTLTTASDALATNKNKTRLIVRGAVYAPRARVSIDPRGNSAQTVLSAGLIAGRLVLTADAAISPDKLQIGSGGASGVRRVQIKAEAVERAWCGCANDIDPTGPARHIIGYSTVAISGAGAMTIESWRIGS